MPEPLGEALSRRLRSAQATDRMPSVAASVSRGGELVWQDAVGLADVERGELATTVHRYRIGSITKTFTAVLVLQLRDEGLVDLDTPLRHALPEAPAGPTVRHALAHLSGLQREPPGHIWESLRMPDREALLAGLEDAERVLPAGLRWHYSNLAFGLLGELVARRRGAPYGDVLRERLLEPLGLEATRLTDEPPAATGYFVEPYSDGVRREAHVEIPETPAAMGQLWSTVRDLARWGAFLAEGRDAVLARTTLDEMALVQTMVDTRRWTLGWGLGLELYRRGDRVFAGHGGAMPGFLAGLVVERESGVGAAVLTNAGAGPKPELLALELAEQALEELPEERDEWRPDEGAPADVAPLLGRWWTEGHELVVRWRGGRLEVQALGWPEGRDLSVLEPEGDDRFRVVEGRELGELVRVVRDEAGEPVKLYFATYPCTRTPETFAAAASDSSRSPAA